MARIVVDDLLNVKPEEDCVILVDSRTPYEISNFLREAAIAAGARTTLINLPTPPFGKGYNFAFLPPDPVSAAIKEADAIINLSLGYSGPLIEAIGPPPKARGIFLGQGNDVDESLVRTVAQIDIQKLRERVEKIKDLWQGSGIAKITSKLGTDVTVDIRGVVGIADHGFTRPEGPRYAWLPPGLCSIVDVAPMDGTLVFNGICHLGDIHGIPDEPIRMKVKNNLIVDVKGDRNLWPQMKRYLDSLKDPKVYSIPAHIGIGLNPNALVAGKGTEWERVEGTVLFGIGDNSALSKLLGLTSNRTVKASMHWDCQMFGATVKMNDTLILDDGKITI